MDRQQIERSSQEQAEIAACDAFTVVAQAKKSLYKGGGQPDPWIAEALSRLDAQTRAVHGTFVPAGSLQQQTS